MPVHPQNVDGDTQVVVLGVAVLGVAVLGVVVLGVAALRSRTTSVVRVNVEPAGVVE